MQQRIFSLLFVIAFFCGAILPVAKVNGVAIPPHATSAPATASAQPLGRRIMSFFLRMSRGSNFTAQAAGTAAPLAWWKLDGDALDATGNGNDATVKGNPTFRPGKDGSALQLNGNKQYAQVTKDDTFDALSETTIAGWIKFTANTRFNAWFSYGTKTTCDKGLELAITGGKNFEVWGTAGGCATSFRATVPMPNPTSWHHLAYVVSATGNQMYIDGAKVTPTYGKGNAGTKFSFANAAAGTSTALLGGTTDTTEYFNGSLDDIRVYTVALTAADIAALAGAATSASSVSSTRSSVASSARSSSVSSVSSSRSSVMSSVQSSVASSATSVATSSVSSATGGGDPTSLPLLQKSNMQYLGAFQLSNKDNANNPVGYGGHALGYNPVNDSLFFGAHDWYQKLCEISTPNPSLNMNALPSATFLQNCVDVTEGKMGQIDDGTVKLGGSFVWNGRLITTAYSYYDADGTQRNTHGASSNLDLSVTNNFSGFFPLSAAANARSIAGYMGVIPQAWRTLFGGPAITGQCCLSIISNSSSGPALNVFNPDDVGVKNPIPGTTVLFYPLSNPLADGTQKNDLYMQSDAIAGVAFPKGTRTVLFIGRHGKGNYCYGGGGASGGDCTDPCDSSKGTHAYPYVHYVWAYDANDLVAVKNGNKKPWDVRPYATWELSDMDTSSCASVNVGGGTFDADTGTFYVTEKFGESPRVHEYHIGL